VLDTSQALALAHPHTQHHNMIVNIGHYKGTGSPIKLARTPSHYETPPPRFAEHTDAILHEAWVHTATNQPLKGNRGAAGSAGGISAFVKHRPSEWGGKQTRITLMPMTTQHESKTMKRTHLAT
jgi:hypothetical protein